MTGEAERILRILGTRGPRSVELVCREHADPRRGLPGWAVMRLGCCLGDVPEDVIPVLLASGLRLSVRLDHCDAPERARARVDQVATYLTALGLRVPQEHDGSGRARRDVHDVHRPHVTRRQLFTVGASPSAPPFPGDTPRERMLSVLRHVVGEQPPVALRDIPAPAARLDAPGCDGCGVCVRACEELALSISRSDTGFSLQQQVQTCTDCGVCSRLCPSHVLMSVGAATWGAVLDDERRTLASGTSRVCTRCQAPFAPQADEHLCPPCAFRTANPFGSRMPLS